MPTWEEIQRGINKILNSAQGLSGGQDTYAPYDRNLSLEDLSQAEAFRDKVIKGASSYLPDVQLYNPFRVQGEEHPTLRTAAENAMQMFGPDTVLGPIGIGGLTSNIKKLRLNKKEYWKPFEEGGSVIFHGIRDYPKGSTENKFNSIVNEGFKFSNNRESLTPYSISFFTDKKNADRFGSKTIAFSLPEDTKLLDIRNNKNLTDYYEFILKEGDKGTWNYNNLKKYGGYDGVIDEANGGTEIRIYNKNKLPLNNIEPIIFD